MANSPAQNSFNIGRDAKINSVFSAGLLQFNIVTEFDHKPKTKNLESEAIDGQVRTRQIFMGHSGSFRVDRQDGTVQDYFAQLEANFYAGLPPDVGVITMTVSELDGSQSQYQWTGVTLRLTDGGSWKGLDKVTHSIEWDAIRWIKTL